MSREVLDGEGEVEIGIGVMGMASWAGKSSTAQHGALTQMLPCLWLCAGWPEKSTREPFSLLEMAVRVVSLAASCVSFCLSTAVPVLGTVSRFLPACRRCAAPLGQPGLGFYKRQQFYKRV